MALDLGAWRLGKLTVPFGRRWCPILRGYRLVEGLARAKSVTYYPVLVSFSLNSIRMATHHAAELGVNQAAAAFFSGDFQRASLCDMSRRVMPDGVNVIDLFAQIAHQSLKRFPFA